MEIEMEEPLVSVIVPSYNHEKYIKQCILSIVEQTYKNIELIVVDDVSTDSTIQEVLNIEKICSLRFVNFTIKSNIKGNISTSCNAGIDIAHGKYIYIIASDDKAAPHAIITLVDFLEKNDNYVLAVGDNAIINSVGNIIGWDKDRNIMQYEHAQFKTFGELIGLTNSKNIDRWFGAYERLIFANHIPNGYLIRKDSLIKAGKYNPAMIIEDWYIALQLAKVEKFKFINDILFYYRWHGNNIIRKYDQDGRSEIGALNIYLHEYEYCKSVGYDNIINHRIKYYMYNLLKKISMYYKIKF